MDSGYGTLTDKQVKEEIESLRRVGKKIRRTKATAKAFLIKCGFITKSGKLTKRYGG